MLYQNGVQLLATGEIILSTNIHDFKYFLHGSFIDGGLEYIRRGFNDKDRPHILDISLDDQSSESELQEHLCWGTRGVDGDKPLTYRYIKDLDISHLKALIVYNNVHPISTPHFRVIQYWEKIKSQNEELHA